MAVVLDPEASLGQLLVYFNQQLGSRVSRVEDPSQVATIEHHCEQSALHPEFRLLPLLPVGRLIKRFAPARLGEVFPGEELTNNPVGLLAISA